MNQTITAPSNGRLRSYLVVRYDDFGAAYSPACKARFEVEAMLHREMSARGWSWLCSVTPRQSVDPENVAEERTIGLWEDTQRVELLRQAVVSGLCEPAVHGLTHHTWKQLPRWGTEFEGLPVQRQYDLLRAAKRDVEELTGKSVSVFVPPWNSYDRATLEAAARAGLGLFSGGQVVHVPGPVSVRRVPCTVELINLWTMMDRGHRYPRGSVVVLMTHATDFVSVDRSEGYLELDEFGPLLDRVVEHFGMHVVPICRVPDLVGPDLEPSGDCAADLFHRCERLSGLPLAGRRLQHWLLPHGSALLPLRHGLRVSRSLTAALTAWFVGIATLACLPAAAVAHWVERDAWRTWAWMGLVLFGLALVVRSGCHAFLKRYRGRWGTRRIGLRTWTGLTAGLALALSALLPGVWSLLSGRT